MNRHERRTAKAKTGWIPMTQATKIPRTPEQIEAMVQGIMRDYPEHTEQKVRALVRASEDEMREMWKNDLYTVSVIPWRPININGREHNVIQLSIRRNDRAAAHDWRDFQRIKNDIIGEEYEAIELYPAESRLVDTANQYHLFVVADPAFRFPFGYTERTVGSNSYGGAVQRPLEEDK